MSITTSAPAISPQPAPEVLEHAWPVRLTHWVMAAAIEVLRADGLETVPPETTP